MVIGYLRIFIYVFTIVLICHFNYINTIDSGLRPRERFANKPTGSEKLGRELKSIVEIKYFLLWCYTSTQSLKKANLNGI